MSNAKPMGNQRRALNYGDPPLWMTPRQRRRYVHKDRRSKVCFGYPGTKGYETPRRAAARAAMLERRRG